MYVDINLKRKPMILIIGYLKIAFRIIVLHINIISSSSLCHIYGGSLSVINFVKMNFVYFTTNI